MPRSKAAFSDPFLIPDGPLSGARARQRACDHPGCAGEGSFRAPRGRNRLDSYFWFCLDHVREYNAAWNYYSGMNEAEIEAEMRQDTVWQRPTWPLGWRIAGHRLHDPFDALGEGGEAERAKEKKRKLSPEEKALAVFDLSPPFTLPALKKRYKTLVKLHHPDANGGDKGAEERLKIITQAYATLKARYFA